MARNLVQYWLENYTLNANLPEQKGNKKIKNHMFADTI